ncbi:hypothetical protein COR50_02910 [Chitinophaga caeni]|uniref:Uncharacterized protein n=1 Tax=Chitinophaga caeni TaxID=2029983 RepID=A0A291QQK3_9BACT|nr:hypothetical protein [Chitinophaga caeni]ATL46201.1 hypothetical protein COR50_02910 [Chitinophaga caeni]
MSNSTLPLFNANSYAASHGAGNNVSDMNEEISIQAENQQLVLVTQQALDSIKYSPRPESLQAIFDYANTGEKR